MERLDDVDLVDELHRMRSRIRALRRLIFDVSDQLDPRDRDALEQTTIDTEDAMQRLFEQWDAEHDRRVGERRA